MIDQPSDRRTAVPPVATARKPSILRTIASAERKRDRLEGRRDDYT